MSVCEQRGEEGVGLKGSPDFAPVAKCAFRAFDEVEGLASGEPIGAVVIGLVAGVL